MIAVPAEMAGKGRSYWNRRRNGWMGRKRNRCWFRKMRGRDRSSIWKKKQTVDVSERELAELLRSMPDNVVIRVEFGEAGADGRRE